MIEYNECGYDCWYYLKIFKSVGTYFKKLKEKTYKPILTQPYTVPD